MLKSLKSALFSFVLPFFIVCAPFFAVFVLTHNVHIGILSLLVAVVAFLIYLKGWHNIDFCASSRQKLLFVGCAALLVVLSFFLCAVSIEGEWLLDYPLKGSVDEYGCYIQTFDAFQKGQLNIDTEYDLSILEDLENPYDYISRSDATGERTGPIWDRAYYNGKLYSYFGVAPLILFYYPCYILTGKVLSDALAAAVMSAVICCLAVALVFLLSKRIDKKTPLLLSMLGALTLPFGALVFPTLTNANFYHLAVLSGILTVLAFFVCVLLAVDSKDGKKRKIFFALSGFFVAAVVASRPNMVLYVLIALPLLISVIKKCEYGKKSLLLDITAFLVPMVVGGVLIMLYNLARFGSPFDFGTAYQLTIVDTSIYSFTPSLFVPSLYHYFMHKPKINEIFPYIHIYGRELVDYGVGDRFVYLARSIGAGFFPAVWGCVCLPLVWERKKIFCTGITAVCVTVFLAYFNMCFAGIHLRYLTDILFVLVAVGIFVFMYAVADTKKGTIARKIAFAFVVAILFSTVLVSIPMIFDNERVMIMRTHPDFFLFMAKEW